MTEVVVSDTSPLQYLHLADAIGVLPRLYGRIIVPLAVVAELAAGKARGYHTPSLDGLKWVEITAPISLRSLPSKLGIGEQEAISMAVERGLPLLVDDRDARLCARGLGLVVVGTFGVLLEAKRHGFVERIAPLLERIIASGFRLDPAIRQRVLELAGEPDLR